MRLLKLVLKLIKHFIHLWLEFDPWTEVQSVNSDD